jgi:hypothetical protein
MKIVVNKCYGEFVLSNEAYGELIRLGIPVKKYIEQKRGKGGLYIPEPKNEGFIIFDRLLSKGENNFSDADHIRLFGRYWDTWTRDNRTHPLLVKVVERLGKKASGSLARLEVIEIPDGIKWEIDDYDGIETVHEQHRSW